MTLPRHVGLLGLLVLLVTPSGIAMAQGADDLRLDVRGSAFEEDGSTQLILNVTGPAKPETLDASAFTVTENGQVIAGGELTPLLDDEGEAEVVTLLAIDISGSMRGASMDATRPAAINFAQELTGQGVPVALMTFGSNTRWLSDPTTDGEQLTAIIEDIVVGGSTALYDAIIEGSERLVDQADDRQLNLVVFTDRGGDTSSEASLEEAIGAANEIEAPVLFAALEVVPEDLEVIDAIAEGTNGRVLIAADVNEIAGVFEELAADLASQYVLTYTSTISEPEELDVSVGVAANGVEASTSFVTPNPRQQLAPTIRPPSSPGLLSSPVALWTGVAGAFLAILLMFGLMFTGHRTSADRVLAGQLERYIERGDRRAGRSGLVATHFRERAMELLESTPKPKGFDEKLTMRLEQAAWPLRNGEFILLSIGSALIAGVVVGLFTNPLGGLLLAVIAGAVPWLILEVRRSRRQDAFLRNLPDTLQLMAGSLRAGYGVIQALDTVAKESSGPAAEEFQRVITEARLGMPVEDALEAMAERIGSEDFRWVVLAINVQREVGGNLAELLDTVAETLREREMLRRQIKVLSAEGRLSAVILVALPFVLAIYLILVRPEYIGALVTSGLFGWAMVVGASTLMLIGVIWIRKMIQIEV
jgi:tight adherence protein B